jgi:uncharacterized protein
VKKSILIVFSLLLFAKIFAYDKVEDIPDPTKQQGGGWVANPDGILAESTVYQLNVMIDSLRKTNGVEVAVVAVNSIGNNEIQTFATKLGEHWGVGKEYSDNGLMILFVLDQKKVNFSTGYGLEGVLPDIICKRIQTETMIPHFRKENYDEGMLAGLQRAISTVKNEEFASKPLADWVQILLYLAIGALIVMLLTFFAMQWNVHKIRRNSLYKTNIDRFLAFKKRKTGIFIIAFLFLFVGLFFISNILNTFLPLVLIIFLPLINLPSIIYSRVMMKKLRTESIKCDSCGAMMRYLPESEEDKYLTLAQQFEEILHAVDYDVFECENCKNETIFPLEQATPYIHCPKCDTKAFRLTDKHTILAPTYVHQGKQNELYQCAFCKYQENRKTAIPRLERSAAYIGSGGTPFSSGSGGFGGGGGGSDFGGGSFGGGGASSGW